MLTETQTVPQNSSSVLRKTKWAVAIGLLVLVGFAASVAMQQFAPNEYKPQAFFNKNVIDLTNPQSVSPPPKIEGPVDLMALIELDRHSRSGQGWKKSEDALLIPAGNPSKLLLPAELPEQFRFELSVERIDESGPFVFGVNATGQHYYLIIDVMRKNGQVRMTALGTLQGKIAEAAYGEFSLPQGERVDLSLISSQQKIVLKSADKVVLKWEGDVSELALGAGWGIGNDPGLFVGSNNNARFEVSRLEVMPLSVVPGTFADPTLNH